MGQILGTIQVNGTIQVGEGAITNTEISSGAAIARSKLAQDTAQKYIAVDFLNNPQ